MLTGLGTGGEWALRSVARGRDLETRASCQSPQPRPERFLRWLWSRRCRQDSCLAPVRMERGVRCGAVPAVFSVWTQRNADESPEWLRSKTAKGATFHLPKSHFDISRESAEPSNTGARVASHPLIGPSVAWLIVITLLMNTSAMFAWWSLFTWLPSYLALPVVKGGRGMTIGASTY